MKIENLKEGMVLKNYKELCKMLEIEPLTSNSKKAQLKDIECCCKYHRDKNKYIIDKIYDIPLERIDNRVNNRFLCDTSHGLYTDDIQALIMSVLPKKHGTHFVTSFSALIEDLSFVNSNYTKGREMIYNLSKIEGLPLINCMDFYRFVSSNLKIKLTTALDSLEEKSYILVERIIYIDINEIIKDNKVRKHRPATNEEKQILLTVERDTLKNNNWEIVPYTSPSMYEQFKKEVKKELKKYDIYLNYYYKAYDITINNNCIYNTLDTDEISLRLNTNVINSVIKTAKSRHKRACEKAEILMEMDEENNLDNPIKFSSLHYDDDYVSIVEQLADSLMKLETKEINFN